MSVLVDFLIGALAVVAIGGTLVFAYDLIERKYGDRIRAWWNA